MDKRATTVLLVLGLIVVTGVGIAALLRMRPVPVDPKFATPQACLEEYIRAVKAVEEEAELATGTIRARSEAERERGPDKARRLSSLKGKSALFHSSPIQIIKVKEWGDIAKILVTQGGTEESPIFYVYTLLREDGAWKIDNIEMGRDMRW